MKKEEREEQLGKVGVCGLYQRSRNPTRREQACETVHVGMEHDGIRCVMSGHHPGRRTTLAVNGHG